MVRLAVTVTVCHGDMTGVAVELTGGLGPPLVIGLGFPCVLAVVYSEKLQTMFVRVSAYLIMSVIVARLFTCKVPPG